MRKVPHVQAVHCIAVTCDNADIFGELPTAFCFSATICCEHHVENLCKFISLKELMRKKRNRGCFPCPSSCFDSYELSSLWKTLHHVQLLICQTKSRLRLFFPFLFPRKYNTMRLLFLIAEIAAMCVVCVVHQQLWSGCMSVFPVLTCNW